MPDVTGTPVQLYYYTELLKKSYVQAAYYSLAAIALMVAHPFPHRFVGNSGVAAGRHRLHLAGRFDGRFWHRRSTRPTS